MNIETRKKYDDFIRAISAEIAEEQPDMNNIDYTLPITNELHSLLNYGFFDNEIAPVAKAISLNMKKTSPVGKWDNEAPVSYRRFEKKRNNLICRLYD